MPPRPQLTHFLCIPLVTPVSRPQLQTSLSSFIQNVTNKSTPENPDGIPERAIRPLGTLHLTLGVMSLLNEDRVQGALGVLRGLNLKGMLEEEGERKDLSITLQGLASMHTPSSQTSILYTAPVDPDHRLQSFCERLRDAFVAAGFIVPEARPLLLHATILNTVYVPGVRGKGSGHGKNRARLTIDAREILEDYAETVWMRDVPVDRVAICRMGAKKVDGGGDGEEYVVEGELELSR